jgi:hypothetical protein
MLWSRDVLELRTKRNGFTFVAGDDYCGIKCTVEGQGWLTETAL